jgi:pyrroline-5-carboxylate reductase
MQTERSMPETTTQASVTILGLGRMGTALARGLLEAGWPPERLCGIDAEPSARARAKSLGITVAALREEAPAATDVVVLAVKPKDVASAVNALAPHRWPAASLLLSLAAGVPTARLSPLWGARPLVRAMPNLAATIGRAVTALYAVPACEDAARAWAGDLLSAVGEVYWCPREEDLDTATALSGSGLAYVLLLMEAMIEEGVALGLPRSVAERLVSGTVAATPALLAATGAAPTALCGQVASPGGTTEAALRVLGDGGFEPLVRSAVRAAWARALALGGREQAT